VSKVYRKHFLTEAAPVKPQEQLAGMNSFGYLHTYLTRTGKQFKSLENPQMSGSAALINENRPTGKGYPALFKQDPDRSRNYSIKNCKAAPDQDH